MQKFVTFLQSKFGDCEAVLLSATNNQVYRLWCDGRVLIAKNFSDADIPIDYYVEASRALAQHIAVQRISDVFLRENGEPFDVVIAEHIEGQDLATVLAEGGPARPEPELLAQYFCRYLVACRELPRMYSGFGMYKRGESALASHRAFVERFAARYWSRVRPFYEGRPVAAAVDHWIASGLAEALERHPSFFDTVAIDSNLKNFVVSPDGRITVLNVPIAAMSTPAQAVGAISVHLRGLRWHGAFLDTVERELRPLDLAMVPHFELWALLGILSFYAVRDPGGLRQWRNWGAPTLLDDDFQNLASELMARWET